MTREQATWAQEAFERGYKEALLDVFCFLTGNEQILDYPERFAMLENLAEQVNKTTNKLQTVD